MNNAELDAALKAMGAETTRPAAIAGSDEGAFRRAVWKEIRHQKALGQMGCPAGSSEEWMAGLRVMFPKFALAGLVVAVGVAWVAGSAMGDSLNSQKTGVTTRMLNLEVFSPQSDDVADVRLLVKR